MSRWTLLLTGVSFGRIYRLRPPGFCGPVPQRYPGPLPLGGLLWPRGEGAALGEHNHGEGLASASGGIQVVNGC